MPEDIPARRARQAGYYRAMKAAGLVPVRDWCYPEDREAVHEVCRQLRQEREWLSKPYPEEAK